MICLLNNLIGISQQSLFIGNIYERLFRFKKNSSLFFFLFDGNVTFQYHKNVGFTIFDYYSHKIPFAFSKSMQFLLFTSLLLLLLRTYPYMYTYNPAIDRKSSKQIFASLQANKSLEYIERHAIVRKILVEIFQKTRVEKI